MHGRLPFLPILLFLLALPSRAPASEGENSITGGLSYDRLYRYWDAPSHGFGASLAWRHGLRDDLNLYVQGSYAAFVGPRESADEAAFQVGASYILDSVSWIPEFFVSVGYYGPVARRFLKPDVGVSAGIGAEYRRYAEFGVGVRGEYRYLIRNRDAAAGTMSFTMYVAKYF
jgi:hypothetical protein